MEQSEILIPESIVQPEIKVGKTENQANSFITANTVPCTLDEISQRHIIPVFVKDNEPLISQTEFIEAAINIAAEVFHGEHILKPKIRVSHPIKGRIPEAKDKPANQLQEREKTLYYERMMFLIEIPSVQDNIDGNQLSLTIGGVKAYSQDNLYSRSLSDQHFKVFIGFQNKVCTNLCVWTDGYMDDLKVKNSGQLKAAIYSLAKGYNENFHLFHLKKLTQYGLTESQFAHMIGRCRMYNHLPADLKTEIPPIQFGDQQMSTVVKDFYKEGLCKDRNDHINLWRLYNLFTGANKSSYIDSFLDRSVNAFNLVEQIRKALEDNTGCWYLN